VSETNTSNPTQRIFTKEDFLLDPEAVLDSLLAIEGGLALFDKSYGVSSYTVVYLLRKVLSRRSGEKWIKVGHGGTLDPLATGLVILGSRRATRSLTQFLGSPKVYETEIRLGITSPCYDLEKPITVTHDLEGISEEVVRNTVMGFEGKQLQTPPIFSAIKQGGKAVYHKARKGKTVTIEPKEIEIYSITDLSVTLPYIRFTVCCSKGTYIRSLANDIGVSLGTGATLTALRRIKIGEHSVEDAIDPNLLSAMLSEQPIEAQ
jgi:tRNA pseudouridine55 synthase